MGIEAALEESIEDAFIAYLKANLPGEIKVFAAWGAEELQYPAVVVHAGTSRNHNEDAQFNWRRNMDVDIGILTEAAPAKDEAGKIILTPRERNRALRAAVIQWLAVSTTDGKLLHDFLNGMNIPGVVISLAHMNEMVRNIRPNGRIFESTIRVEVIAQPKAI